MPDPVWLPLLPIAGALAGYGFAQAWPARIPRLARALAALALALMASGLSRTALVLVRSIARRRRSPPRR